MFLVRFLTFAAFVLIFSSSMVLAQVSTVQALNFGNWISLRNDAQYDITVNTDGTYSFDSAGFVLITPPTEGIYDITTSNLNTTVASVDVTQFNPLFDGDGTFQMVNFQVTHSAASDGAGVVRVTVGATARSSGSGAAYTDVTRSGSIDIEINF